MTVVCLLQPHHLVADLLLFTSGRDIRARQAAWRPIIACRAPPCSAIAPPRPIPYPRSVPCSVRRARLALPRVP